MKSNLDVWAIQHYPEELYTALKRINGGMNIIYSNVLSNLKIGNKIIQGRNFNTFLYNEESDILIMLMNGCKVNKNDIIKYLEENNKDYAEVNFMPITRKQISNEIPELWFARDLEVMEDAIKDSISKNNTDCIVYPFATGTLELEYLTKYYEKVEIDGRIIKDIIKFRDKIILVINNDIDYVYLLNKYKINYYRSNNTEPNIHKNTPKKLKKLI